MSIQQKKVFVLVIGVLLVAGAVLSSRVWTNRLYKPDSDGDYLRRNDSYTRGANKAGVVFVEFSNFQCPSCSVLEPVLRRVRSDYADKVTFVYRNFPEKHFSHSTLAALAAEAAGEQGKFWEMHDLLLERQTEWSQSSDPTEQFISFARKLELDAEQFEKALKTGKFIKKIERDIADGAIKQVRSAPAFFIGETQFTGVPSYAELKQALDNVLERQ